MQGFVRTGLLPSAVTGALVLGGGTVAAAAISPTIPIQACDIAVDPLSPGSDAMANLCPAGDPGASAAGSANGSGGLLSGLVVDVAVTTPVKACGDAVAVAGDHSGAVANDCQTGTPPGGAPILIQLPPPPPGTPAPAPGAPVGPIP